MKKDNSPSKDDIAKMIANPFYATNIDPMLSSEHETLVSEEVWIQSNKNLIKEIGAEKWLKLLLSILQGDYPR